MKKLSLVLFCFTLSLLANGQSIPLDLKTIASLKIELDSIYTTDQKYRHMMDSIVSNYGLNSEQASMIFIKMEKNDSLNQIRVKQILDQYGWIGADEVGDTAGTALFLVIQHADQATQEKYLPMLREAVKNRKAKGSHLAMMEDRVALGQGKKQLYGTQIKKDPLTGKFYLAPIEDEVNVNKLRAEVGLQPLEEYVKRWNIEYRLPEK